MARSRQFSNQVATIAASGTKSNAIDGRDWDRFAIIKPATTGTAVTFEVSTSSTGTFTPLLTTGSTAASVTCQAAAGTYPIPESLGLDRFPWFKIVSGSTEVAERAIVVTKAKI